MESSVGDLARLPRGGAWRLAAAGAAGVVLVLAATSCSPTPESRGGPAVGSMASVTATSGPRPDVGGGTGRSDKAASPTSTREATSPVGRAKSHSPLHGAAAGQGSAAAVLAELAVKGRSAKTGYSRDQFGSAWSDTDQNGCNTRDDILAVQLTRVVRRGSCVVTSGVLSPDPYTGTTITYTRGASRVDIDHVVALGDAWVKGAQYWDFAKRVAFANDPVGLLAVQDSANRQKSDSDAASWLPANKSFRCAYVARQIRVKHKYGLWVTSAEKAAMQRVLAQCPGYRLPGPGPHPTMAPNVASSDGPGGAGGDSRSARGVTRYANCAAARAAGVAPIWRGNDEGKRDSLYDANTHLDRDKDGIACE